WTWLASYYMCTEGEVMNAALPSGFKLSSETNIVFNESYDGDFDALSNDEFLIVQMLKAQREISISQIQKTLEKRQVYKFLKPLFERGIAFTSEDFVPKYKVKTESYIRLSAKFSSDEKLSQLFDELSRAPKQYEVILAYLQLSKEGKLIRKADLLAKSKSDASAISRLVEKGIFEQVRAEVSRLGSFYADEKAEVNLSEVQDAVFLAIKDSFKEKQTLLLQGVTGSGKTEIYIKLIEEQLAQGKQSLFLLPEIALTAQIINRLKNYFGSVLGVYHSKFNLHERVEIWNKTLSGEYKIIVSARSGIFLPFQNLGLIVVDEEHDSSYKQTEPAPRYNARDCSIILASYFGAKVILGSATPSIESAFNAEKNKYGLVRLDVRYAEIALPEITLEKMKFPNKNVLELPLFSERLLNEIQTSLDAKKQIILFHNRRGFSAYQMCKTCAHVYACKHCDVSLTYHKFQHKLVCHYCGYEEKMQPNCVSCGAHDLVIVGQGTEKIEEDIAAHFPAAKVGRLDLDAVRGKHDHEHIIAAFENREVDILVGTQMVSKGLDFEHVSLVGVIQADSLLYFPNFRANERAFQLLTQVSGRAGRKGKRGKVIIQTAKPENEVLQMVLDNNYELLKATELLHRQQYNFPPFCRLIQVRVSDKNVQFAEEAALFLANKIRKQNQCEVSEPTKPLVGKINNQYLRDVLLKTNVKTQNLASLKQQVREIILLLKQEKNLKAVRVSVDVDPM
ncbi:MAG TPA: primosomal protein N', partial [Chitinophagales bacterium]